MMGGGLAGDTRSLCSESGGGIEKDRGEAIQIDKRVTCCFTPNSLHLDAEHGGQMIDDVLFSWLPS